MKNIDKMKKFKALKETDIRKEIASLQSNICFARLDIANRKTKGIRRIRSWQRDIARLETIISGRKEKND